MIDTILIILRRGKLWVSKLIHVSPVMPVIMLWVVALYTFCIIAVLTILHTSQNHREVCCIFFLSCFILVISGPVLFHLLKIKTN